MGDAQYTLDEFELYRLARKFRRNVYQLVRLLPREEKFCLDQQLRRAAVSVTNNIAEGHGRWHYLENSHFCQIARGSVEELIDDINVCLDEGYGDPAHNEQLKSEAYELVARLNGYLRYLKKTRQGGETGTSNQ